MSEQPTEWEIEQRLSDAVKELNETTAAWNCNNANGLVGRNGPIGRRIAAIEREIEQLRRSLGYTT